MEKYEILHPIGKGNFGTITKIIRKSDKKILVWKEMNYRDLSEKEKKQIVTEVNILRELKNPNIVKYYDRIIDKKNQKIYIIMEYCEKGDLNQLIKRLKKKKEYIKEVKIWEIFFQILLAIHYCHNHKEGKILHRDIKSSNIFLDNDNNIKLGDFGLSRELSNESKFAYSNVGTPYYMSPEQIEENKYNEKSDIWSLGCFLYELCTFNPPFQAKNYIQLALKIKNGKVERINYFYSDELMRVINWMLTINYNDRPSSDDLLNVPQISFRLKEKKIQDNLFIIKVSEDKIKNIEKELEYKEKIVLKKEKEIIKKENELMEKEKRLNELNNKIHLINRNIDNSFNLSNNDELNSLSFNIENDEKKNENNNKELNNYNNKNDNINNKNSKLYLHNKKNKYLSVPISVNSSIKINENNNENLKCQNYYLNISKIPNNFSSKKYKQNQIKKKKKNTYIKTYEMIYQRKTFYSNREKNKLNIKNASSFNQDSSIYNITNENNKKLLFKTDSSKIKEKRINSNTFIFNLTKNSNIKNKKMTNAIHNLYIQTNNIPSNSYQKYVKRNYSGYSINRNINQINTINNTKN